MVAVIVIGGTLVLAGWLAIWADNVRRYRRERRPW